MAPYQNISVFDQPQDTSVNPENVKSVGKFETTGIDGKTYTEKVFSDYDLTLVNCFTTWCSPCVNEMPDLDKLYQEMKEKGVGVVGMVIDSVGEDGTTDEDTVKKAQILKGKNRSYLSSSDSGCRKHEWTYQRSQQLPGILLCR